MQKVQVLVAALHDAQKRANGFPAVPVEQMLANRRLAPFLFGDLDYLNHAAQPKGRPSTRGAVKLLRADDEVHVRQAVNQFLPPALRDAAQEAEHDVGPATAGFSDDVLHLAERLLAPPYPARCKC